MNCPFLPLSLQQVDYSSFMWTSPRVMLQKAGTVLPQAPPMCLLLVGCDHHACSLGCWNSAPHYSDMNIPMGSSCSISTCRGLYSPLNFSRLATPLGRDNGNALMDSSRFLDGSAPWHLLCSWYQNLKIFKSETPSSSSWHALISTKKLTTSDIHVIITRHLSSSRDEHGNLRLCALLVLHVGSHNRENQTEAYILATRSPRGFL